MKVVSVQLVFWSCPIGYQIFVIFRWRRKLLQWEKCDSPGSHKSFRISFRFVFFSNFFCRILTGLRHCRGKLHWYWKEFWKKKYFLTINCSSKIANMLCYNNLQERPWRLNTHYKLAFKMFECKMLIEWSIEL